jgi:hypothetical protein
MEASKRKNKSLTNYQVILIGQFALANKADQNKLHTFTILDVRVDASI